MKLEKERILAIAPHTDDIEFGCGGTIAKLLEDGCDVHAVAFSICEESVPNGFPKDALKNEFMLSMRSFGLADDHIHILNYRVRRFNERRQDILEDMIKLRKTINPSIVFAPSVHDTHQDHNCIAEEAIRAFKTVTLLAYEVPWNHLTFDNTCFIKLENRHIEAKIEALHHYETQAFRAYATKEMVLGQAYCRGIQGGGGATSPSSSKWFDYFCDFVRPAA